MLFAPIMIPQYPHLSQPNLAFRESIAIVKRRLRNVVKILIRPCVLVGAVMPVCCLVTVRASTKTVLCQAHYLIFLSAQLVLAHTAQHYMKVRLHD